MGMPTSAEVRKLEEQAHGAFIPEAAEVPPSSFLSLAPTTSASFPQGPRLRQSTTTTVPLTAAALAAASEEDQELVKRRTSSLSSDGVKRANVNRFLRLGPVHFGEHSDDHNSDWHEVAVE
jgi:hypothetical protein